MKTIITTALALMLAAPVAAQTPHNPLNPRTADQEREYRNAVSFALSKHPDDYHRRAFFGQISYREYSINECVETTRVSFSSCTATIDGLRAQWIENNPGCNVGWFTRRPMIWAEHAMLMPENVGCRYRQP